MALMADFGRLPTQRKVLVFVVAGAMLGALYFQFLFKGLKADIEEAEAENESKVATNRRLEADIPKYAQLKASMAELQRMLDRNQTALPSESELPAFFETLNRKINEAGVQVNRRKQLKEEPIETFIKVPLEIEISGTFMQIKKFFASLVPKHKKPGDEGSPDDNERIVSIDSLTLSNPTVKNREIVLTAKFVATTYRQEEKEAGPAPGAGGPPKPITPSAPKPSAPPMPSPATPQGAKVRTEDALQKGEQRNGNATGVDEAKTPPAGAGSDRLKGGL